MRFLRDAIPNRNAMRTISICFFLSKIKAYERDSPKKIYTYCNSSTIRDIEIALTTSEITDSAGRNVSQYYDSKIDIFP